LTPLPAPRVTEHGRTAVRLARLARLARRARLAGLTALGTLAACGPRAHIPPPPGPASLAGPGVTVLADSGPDSAVVRRVRALAPTLLLQRDEPFTLVRAVAVVHPPAR
jgi:hypothetical protein